jgi:dihydroflavonol-4-reductase
MILVTGATGHIGNVLVRKLVQSGKKVRAFILRGEDTHSINDLDVEKLEGDILDPASITAAFSGIESVFHLAGIISIMPGKDPILWNVNVEGTRNMIQASRQAGIKRFVYTSSIHAIARAPVGVKMDETLGFDPDNPYGEYDRSKAVASLLVQNAVKDGLDAVIVCPTGVIGPYDFRRSEMGEVIRGAAESRPMMYVDGAYDFVDVRDVASGMILAEEKGRAGESYLLSGYKLTVLDLMEYVRKITGKTFSRIKIPFDLARLVSKVSPFYYRITKSKPRITPYSLEVLQSNSDISHAKATRELGYHPRSMYETISDTITWMLTNPKKARGSVKG